MSVQLLSLAILPASLFAVVYFYCRKENRAVDEILRYRLGVAVGIVFLGSLLYMPFYLNRAMNMKTEFFQSVCFACALGLGISSIRLRTTRCSAGWMLVFLSLFFLGYMVNSWVGLS